MAASTLVERVAAPLAAELLRHDLPRLPADRLGETVAFIERRLVGLPSVIRFGVTVIAAVLGSVARGPLRGPVTRFVAAHPLPLVGEFVRLIRSLGYAYVWETWPATSADGAAR